MATEAPERPAEEQAPEGDAEAMKVDQEPAKAEEREQDAAEDKRAKVDASAFAISTTDSSINVMPVAGGKLLMSLTDGGAQHLLAGARTAAGIKKGRYMFEVSMLECGGNYWQNGRGGGNRTQLVRLGFSTAGSSVFADAAGQASFDEEGTFYFGTKRKFRVGERFGKGHVAAVVLNLDAASPNANTLSLFVDGVRVSEPQALPEDMVGKTLFPTVTYRLTTLRVNFGPTPCTALPFKCRMVADAAKDDVELAAGGKAGTKPEVLFPVGLPDRGFFDFVDLLKKSRAGITELSERSSIEWATRSGWRGQSRGNPDSLDRPSFNTGLQELETGSLRSVLNSVAPSFPRDYIVPELRANLVASERQAALARFPKSEFKRTAVVAMGQPNAEFKAHIQSMMLDEKMVLFEREKKKRAQELERKRQFEERKKKAEAARMAREAAAKAKAEAAAAEDKKEGEEPKEGEEAATEANKEGAADAKAEGDAEMKDAEPAEEEMKEPELTEEEKALTFRKRELPDLCDWMIGKWFSQFSLPSKAEGFDEVVFAWENEQASMTLMRDWVMQKKLTQRAEDLQPGQWFKDMHAAYSKALTEWRKVQGEAKDPAWRKAMLAKKREAEKKEGEADAGEAKEVEVDFDELDVFAVEDVCDVGDGRPLFCQFVYEDWALLSTFFELHYLLHAFRRDLDDADRPSFKEKDLGYYYTKYLRKTFDIKMFGVEDFSEFLELVREVMVVDEATGFFKAVLPEDTTVEKMLKVVEEDRRERQRRIDAGDETAQLKFLRPAARARPMTPVGQSRPQHGQGKGGYQGHMPGPSSSAQRRAGYGGGEKRPGGQYLSPAAKQPRYAVGSSYPSRH